MKNEDKKLNRLQKLIDGIVREVRGISRMLRADAEKERRKNDRDKIRKIRESLKF